MIRDFSSIEKTFGTWSVLTGAEGPTLEILPWLLMRWQMLFFLSQEENPKTINHCYNILSGVMSSHMHTTPHIPRHTTADRLTGVHMPTSSRQQQQQHRRVERCRPWENESTRGRSVNIWEQVMRVWLGKKKEKKKDLVWGKLDWKTIHFMTVWARVCFVLFCFGFFLPVQSVSFVVLEAIERLIHHIIKKQWQTKAQQICKNH